MFNTAKWPLLKYVSLLDLQTKGVIGGKLSFLLELVNLIDQSTHVL